MNYDSIADIYSANEKIREHFQVLTSSLTAEEASALSDGEKWTPEELIEHISMVTGGVAQICSRLVKKAKSSGAGSSDGRFAFSAGLPEQLAQSAGAKLEAPDMVKPNGGVPVSESLERLAAAAEAFAALRPELESTDVSGETFPHPYFGPLNAAEWLVLVGLHESRHTRQLESMLARIREK
jgi:hypothetical protein